ncbi:MAG: restriction endonuclease [Ignavibacteriae bacterium]|nr:restriction endonuclease [Ignavibacteriota bacterium]
MKIIEENIFVNVGSFGDSKQFHEILNQIRVAISCVTWSSTNEFIIRPERRGNGVVPIKENFIRHLVDNNWRSEVRMSMAEGMNPGKIDLVRATDFGKFAVEWETGNISSSHRAMNKIAVGIIQGALIGGILVLPVRNLSQYLTDRIGNYEEFTPYLPLYKNLIIRSGVIGIIAIEHDKESMDSQLIPKGKDGNAKKDDL